MNNSEDLSSIINELLKIKEKSGFLEQSWDDWVNSILNSQSISVKNTIENELNNVTYERFYNEWVKNFSLNLDHIWNGNSARELMSDTISDNKCSIVIGRGPSLLKNNHLQLLEKSNYVDSIVCSDGALSTVLENNINPKKF